jgi:dynein heavy chain
MLEKIQHSLHQYLEKKRQLFPRFYFLSNDDLLECLGNSKDPLLVQKHISKCFMGIYKLDLMTPVQSANGCYEVLGYRDQIGEEVKLVTPILVQGSVEVWLKKVEMAMYESLQKLLWIALQHIQKASHKKAALESWVQTTVGQLLITSGQIGWTAKCQTALAELSKNKRSVRKLKQEWHEYLSRMARYVREDLSKIERTKIVALLTIEVHARDVIDRLKVATKTKNSGVNSFEWTSQLRFYYDKLQGEYGICLVKQTNTQFDYGYEYQGNNGRLVVTPLTDRCYMTLTTALHLFRGGSPQGPAGTGKTETVKDLGKSLGKYVVVFNCSEVMTVESLGRNFSGLAQTGAWGCFDEFNRILIEVLSVVALQISSILNACRAGVDAFTFEGYNIRLDRSVGVFVTMNPGYAGRTELPDNLKSLFRPVSMMAPDSQMIAEIMLLAEGFKDATSLSKKIVTIFNMMIQQMSKQDHYAYGLRSIKSVLTRAGALFRESNSEMNEEVVAMRALRDMNVSKLVNDDVMLFENLLSDLFPNTELPKLEYGVMRTEIERQLQLANLQVTDKVIEKILQVYETKNTRHGNMLVGKTCSGKSTAWKILSRTMTALAQQHVPGFEEVEVSVLNPKSIGTDELFGAYDAHTKEWGDGILSNTLRRMCTTETPSMKWLLLDGPVDTLWIESMNTLLDDNKVLTLVNGDRISMPPHVSLLFEVQDLSVASPATVSRCGMIYMDKSDLPWQLFTDSWLAAKTKAIDDYQAALRAVADAAEKATVEEADGEQRTLAVKVPKPSINRQGVDTLAKLFDKYLKPALAFKQKDAQCVDIVAIDEFASVQSLCRLFDSVASVENGVDEDQDAYYVRMIEMWFVFSLIWGVGGGLTADGRARFDGFLRDIEAQFPPLHTVFEYYIDAQKKDWTPWSEKVNKTWVSPPKTPFYKILVPTVDTVRHLFIVNALQKQRINILIAGVTGVGKSALVHSLLNGLNASRDYGVTLNFSAATSSKAVQDFIETRLEKRQRNNFGPSGGRSRLILFIDDLNMPGKDLFGSQPPIELLRQWIDYGYWYDRDKQFQKNVKDMQLIAAMGPPGGARSELTPRFQSSFNVINFIFPEDEQIKRIYGVMVTEHFSDFDEAIKQLATPITDATLALYKRVVTDFLPTPSKSVYLFNMRDISMVVQGVMLSSPKFYDTRESMVRLWVHESLRVFHDRLVDDVDRSRFLSMLQQRVTSSFEVEWAKLFEASGGRMPMFASFIEDDSPVNAVGDDDDEEERAPYQELTEKPDAVKAFMMDKLSVFNMDVENVAQDLVLFEMAIDHVARIYRIITLPRGSAMLVGVGGSGRQSLTRLAAYIANYNVKQVEPTKSYRRMDFYEDLKDLYKMAGVEEEQTVFLFSDTQLVQESFLEDINNILNSGEVPKLFPIDELQPILEDLRPAAEKAGRSTSQDALYDYFISRVRDNLHVVVCMSPVGDEFRNRVRMYPALTNCTTIDWFPVWPERALNQVAAHHLEDLDLGDAKTSAKVSEGLANVFSSMHTAVEETSLRMEQELGRMNYVTPTKYLDLVKGYRHLLLEMRDTIGNKVSKLQNGLMKLDESRAQVESMSVELTDKKKIVAQKKVTCEKLMVEIVQKQRAADEQKKQVELDAARTHAEAKECKDIQDEAATELEKVLPALQKATDALAKLTKSSVTEVRSYIKPPKPVEKVMCAVMVILEKEPSWPSAKKELNDPNFLNRLQNFEKDKISNSTLKQIGKFTKQKDFNAEVISAVSLAAGAMCEWVVAMELYAKVFRDVEPRRIALRKAESKLSVKQDQLKQAEEHLAEVTRKVAKLEETYNTVGSAHSYVTFISVLCTLRTQISPSICNYTHYSRRRRKTSSERRRRRWRRNCCAHRSWWRD